MRRYWIALICLFFFWTRTTVGKLKRSMDSTQSVSIKPSIQEWPGLKVENTKVSQGSNSLRRKRDEYLSKILTEETGHRILFFFLDKCKWMRRQYGATTRDNRNQSV